jgi:hypothetical protein
VPGARRQGGDSAELNPEPDTARPSAVNVP